MSRRTSTSFDPESIGHTTAAISAPVSNRSLSVKEIPRQTVGASSTDQAAAPDVQTDCDLIVTKMRFNWPRPEVWRSLMFYEQIADAPPLHLRLLLPRPLRTAGDGHKPGDVTQCIYDRGDILKQIKQVDPERCFQFDVIEQNLNVGRSIRLIGGSYTFTDAPAGGTNVALATHYDSGMQPRWFWRPIEALVCHSFHRHILRSMRRNLARRQSQEHS